ncbi:hypothetical protein AGMMS50267_14230 [Spirochaetia bacterium]|nr:hypothetical protein AGMMS50267_14230 [Spirochaetia bacterium]
MITLYNVNQVAEQLGLSVSQIYKMVERKTIPSLKIGASVRISDDHINQFLAKCEGKATEGTNELELLHATR